jgi:hypothetical protein
MRNAFHVVVSLLMWVLFVYYWYVVLGREISRSSLAALGYLSAIVLVGSALTFWWIAHNLRISQEDRRSAGLPGQPEDFTADHLERPIEAPAMDKLQAAQIITIELDEVRGKVYRTPEGVIY